MAYAQMRLIHESLWTVCYGVHVVREKMWWPNDVHWTPDCVVQVQVLATALYFVVTRQDTLLSECLSPPRWKMGAGKFNAGGNSAVD